MHSGVGVHLAICLFDKTALARGAVLDSESASGHLGRDPDEWSEWRGHTTHFASGTHGVFSLRNNKDGSNPRVARTDVDAARAENWWGKAITVSPEQIFQN